jgi:hypothetical protein
LTPASQTAQSFSNVSLESSALIRADLTDLAAGEYTLEIAMTYGDPKTPTSIARSVHFVIHKK